MKTFAGFKDFLLRGNLIELAVAFIIGGAFATVVTAFTNLLIAIISAIFGGPAEVGEMKIGGKDGVAFGPFLNAIIAFIFLAAIVYFAVVVPSEKFRAMKKKEEPVKSASSEELLTEIRDLLASAAGPAAASIPGSATQAAAVEAGATPPRASS